MCSSNTHIAYISVTNERGYACLTSERDLPLDAWVSGIAFILPVLRLFGRCQYAHLSTLRHVILLALYIFAVIVPCL